MARLLSIFFVLILFSIKVQAQLFPSEGAVIHYKIIGFSVPAVKGVLNYKLEIATGIQTKEDSFNKNIIYSASGKEHKIVGEVLSLGGSYTWRMLPVIANGRPSAGFHHFSIEAAPVTDTNEFRLRVVQQALKYKDAYVFLDATRTLYDMKGQPVWYLPLPDDGNTDNLVIRDLKTTTQKTITYIIDKKGVFEINYNGDSLWKGPESKSTGKGPKSFYHHEFTRLKNGHYMALGDENVFAKLPVDGDTVLHIMPVDKVDPSGINRSYSRLIMGTITEYDRKGSVVWSWRSAERFNGSDLLYRQSADGKKTQVAPHDNSFYFDEPNKCIYLSCRDINRVIKIKYPEGIIAGVYGDEGKKTSGSAFCGQHSCRLSAKGDLYLYNNNACNPGHSPSAVMMKMYKKDSLEKIWEYESGVPNSALPKEFSSGGNVLEMPDEELFVSMAFPGSNVFIVSKDKKILWDAIVEKRKSDGQQWEPMRLYRASIINSRKDLEALIWNSEK